MSEWREENIGKVADSFAGGTPSRSRADYFKGDIPWISSGEVNNPYITDTIEKITRLGFENSSAKWIPQNSVLIAMYGATAGQVSRLLINATSNQAVLALVPNKELIDGTFLYYQVKYHKDKFLYLAQGSGQPNLSKDIIDRFKIKIPLSKSVQIRISEILITTDEVIEQTQAAIAKYKAIKQGMLQDLFTRGVDTKTGKLRPTYKQAPELYKESKLGMIPKEWEVDLIGNRINSYSGGTPSRSIEEYFKGSIPWISSSEVNQDEISFTKEYITQEALENSSAKWVPQGAILVALYGATAGQISKLKIDATTNQAVLACLDSQTVTSLYLYYLLCFNRELILYKAQGSGQPNLSKQIIDRTIVNIPNLREQKEVTQRLAVVDKKIEAEQAYLEKLKQIKAGLMSDLLSGRKEVKIKES